MSQGYSDVAIIAPVTVTYERYSEHGATWFFGCALRAMLNAAGLEKTDVDGLAVSSFTLAPDGPQSLLNHFDLSARWLESVPYGGASGIIAVRRAARAVQAGDADIVACIGADTNKRGGFADLIGNFSRFSTDAVHPYGAAGPNAVFALLTRAYMDRYEIGREDLGQIAVAQRSNAIANPNALLRKPLDLDGYLNARVVAEPLHLFDCVMPCAGAEGVLVTSVERAKSLRQPYVTILSSAERHNAFWEDPVQFRGGWSLDREALFAQAGLTQDSVNFVQTYDDYPVVSLMQLEDLGFLPKGGGAEFLRSTNLTTTGDGLPVNTSGGQLSSGQAGAAGGFLGIVEAVRQLTDQPLGQSVADAAIGVVSGYGMVNYDRCLCTSAAILRRGRFT